MTSAIGATSWIAASAFAIAGKNRSLFPRSPTYSSAHAPDHSHGVSAPLDSTAVFAIAVSNAVAIASRVAAAGGFANRTS